jgi:hypothetical protein
VYPVAPNKVIWLLVTGPTLRQAYAQVVSLHDPDGPVLPDLTDDEQGGFDSLEADLLENVPPHHG